MERLIDQRFCVICSSSQLNCECLKKRKVNPSLPRPDLLEEWGSCSHSSGQLRNILILMSIDLISFYWTLLTNYLSLLSQVDTFTSVYKKLTGRDVTFEFPEPYL